MLSNIKANIEVTVVRIRENTKATLITLFSSPSLSIEAAAFWSLAGEITLEALHRMQMLL
jgi:hypothetical protein